MNLTSKHVVRFVTLIFSILCLAVSASSQESKSETPLIPDDRSPIPYDLKSWKEFSTSQGGFSIRMPAPLVVTPPESVPLSAQQNWRAYSSRNDTGSFSVSFVDVRLESQGSIDSESLLDREGNTIKAVKGAMILSERAIDFADGKGREWLVWDETDDSVRITRSVISDGRVFNVSLKTSERLAFGARTPSANPTDRTEWFQTITNTYFNSFRIFPRGTKL